jgi:hypothetical protein
MTTWNRKVLALSFAVSTAVAQAQPSGVPAKGAQARVLDFDAEVIEGEKQRPDFLFQTGTPGVSLDSLLFGRKDFNDFLKVDKKRRPGYVAPSGKGETRR